MADLGHAATTTAAAPRTRQRVFVRFTFSQRLQHFLLASSFIGLVTTGFPMRFPDLLISRLFITLLGGIGVVGIIHRILGCIMMLAAVIHVVYLAQMFFRGHRGFPILFGRGDFSDFVNDLKFIFGLSEKRVRFGRYNWREKFDYFGAAFGVALMGVTGIIIWAPQYFTEIFPGWVVTAAVILHDYEAILAGLAIFLSHFYWVHLNPDVYPMSMVWLTGHITEEEMALHHPKEYEQLLEREASESRETALEHSGAAEPEPEPAAAGEPADEERKEPTTIDFDGGDSQ
jgi:cytochrome b subunit of formate dehydrogenase